MENIFILRNNRLLLYWNLIYFFICRMLSLHESGFIAKWKTDRWPERKCDETQSFIIDGISLEEIQSSFYLIAIGFVCSCIVLSIEKMLFSCHNNKSTKKQLPNDQVEKQAWFFVQERRLIIFTINCEDLRDRINCLLKINLWYILLTSANDFLRRINCLLKRNLWYILLTSANDFLRVISFPSSKEGYDISEIWFISIVHIQQT